MSAKNPIFVWHPRRGVFFLPGTVIGYLIALIILASIWGRYPEETTT